MKPSEQLQELIPSAVKTLEHIFTNHDHTEEELVVARLATSTLATWARLKQTEGAQEAVYYSMARDIADSPQQLNEYIKATLPNVPLAKVLPKKLPGGKA